MNHVRLSLCIWDTPYTISNLALTWLQLDQEMIICQFYNLHGTQAVTYSDHSNNITRGT